MSPVLCPWLRLTKQPEGKPEYHWLKFGDQLGKCCCVFPLAPVYQFQCLFLIYHCLFILVYYMIRMKMFLVVCESSNI